MTKNHTEIVKNDSVPKSDRVTKTQIAQYIKQSPNKKLLGFDFFLWIYNLSDTSKNNWNNRWLRKVGEEPVILDSALVQKSLSNIELYLQSIGSFRSTVTDSVFLHKRRAEVTYRVEQSIPYRIAKVDYYFQDKFIEPIILGDTANSLIRPGQTYNRVTLEKERQRIVASLQNKGYYQFSTGNITYKADTTAGNRQINLTMNIRQREAGTDKDGNIQYENNPIYRIKEIYINTNYNPALASNEELSRRIRFDTVEYNGIRFIHRGDRNNVRPEVVARAVGIFPNYIYNEGEVKYTLSSITNLKLFQRVNVLFSDLPDDENNLLTYAGRGESGDTIVTTREKNLACVIQCTPLLPQSYTLEGELSTNSNYTGMSAMVGYSNRNIFRGAELFNVSVRGTYQFTKKEGRKDSYEIGASTSLTVPRLLVPFSLNTEKRLYNVGTKFELSYSSQRRPDYDRTLSTIAFGYEWSTGKFSRFVLKPVDVSYLNVPWIDEDFLNSIENPYLKSTYESQLIAGLFGSYTYNNQGFDLPVATVLRLNYEANGNLCWGLSRLLGKKHETADGTRNKILGVPFAQYVRADLNLSYAFTLNDANKLIYRFYAGAGKAYGNSNSLPFERMFFAGGSSSMRGWQVRTLGPGNMRGNPDAIFPNQLGDFKLETNLESRFRIRGLLYGAIFADVGNIWYIGKGQPDKESKFRFNRFYKQLGFNTGAGLRFDFGFFLARLDWGIQIHNPSRPAGDRWISNLRFRNTALHFAIGYPF